MGGFCAKKQAEMFLILNFINHILLISRRICEVKKKKIDTDILKNPGGSQQSCERVF